MPAGQTLEITDENFEGEVEKAIEPVLLVFQADWCMPCRMLERVIDELAEEYSERLKVGAVDTDGNRGISLKFGVNAIPTVLIFREGRLLRKLVGLQQKEDLAIAVEEVLDGQS